MAEVAGVTRALAHEVDPQESALRRLIDSERAALDQSLDRLGERFRETVDWRRQASRHRGALIAAASGAALLGAWRMRRRRSTAERAAHVLVDGAREVTTQACEVLASLGSLVSVRRRVPKVVLAPLAAAAARAALKWWDGDRAGRQERPGQARTHEEESWRLERKMS
jgi:hypothetical protein